MTLFMLKDVFEAAGRLWVCDCPALTHKRGSDPCHRALCVSGS